MKVVHVISGLRVGGAEMMLLKLLSRADRAREDPVVVSLSDRGAVAGKIETLGIAVHFLGMRPGAVPAAGFRRLVGLLRGMRPDLVQGWMYHGNLAALLGAVFLSPGMPVLWNIRGTNTDLRAEKPGTALAVWLGARLSRFPARIVTNSRTSVSAHVRELGYRAGGWTVIPNGFDTALFSPSAGSRACFRAELGLAAQTFLVGMVGRYHPVKDHGNFLRAAGLLARAHPEVRFVLIGAGADSSNPELMGRIRDLGLGGAVLPLGARDDMGRVTAALDIACSASCCRENFPNVIGEAMSCGVPCVVTDVGESAWIVGEASLVVPPGDPEALAAAWDRLIGMGRDRRLDLGLAARRRVVENFSLDTVAQRYRALYEEVLDGKGKAS